LFGGVLFIRGSLAVRSLAVRSLAVRSLVIRSLVIRSLVVGLVIRESLVIREIPLV
jgi:hypothetical protein